MLSLLTHGSIPDCERGLRRGGRQKKNEEAKDEEDRKRLGKKQEEEGGEDRKRMKNRSWVAEVLFYKILQFCYPRVPTPSDSHNTR